MIKAAIFDLDGSMVDSMWLWRSIDIEYLGRFGIPLPEQLQADIEGMSFSETAAYFKKRFALSDDLEQIKADWNRMAFEKYEREVPLKKGVQELLDYCKAHHILLGIATSNSPELIQAVNGAYHFDRYMSCIVTACSVNKGKPAPDVYLEAARQLDVKPEDCLVFEDIVKGLEAGKNAGMKVCAIEDLYSASQRTKKREICDYYIESYDDIKNGCYYQATAAKRKRV